MFDWFRSRTARRVDPTGGEPGPDGAADPAADPAAAVWRIEARADESLAVLRVLHADLQQLRAESGETSESLKKLARSHGRTALRVEEIERKLEALPLAAATAGDAPVPRAPEELFDALDLLDRALEAARRLGSLELADGLGGVHARLVQYLAAAGFNRVAPLGLLPDGRLVRVVGTADVANVREADPTPEHAELPDRMGESIDGRVVTVVRAAITHGERLVREGEVITAKRREPSESLA